MRETLIYNFLRISEIPRLSGNEEKIANFFVDVAKINNLYFFKDDNNNVYIRKKGNIDSKPVALQAHLDMVCVKKKNSKHDFITDGIEVLIDGDRVTAKDTSLGADQGVGLTMMLTLLEDDTLRHPDLEFLFTTEEETTFNGAITFPYDKVESKRLINLDNANDDSVLVGADGDICNEYRFQGDLIKNDFPSYKISIDGFPGGNSGENIDLSENNAITTMAMLLKDKDIFLNSINGGTFENDLATSCEVIIHTILDVGEIFKDLNTKIEKVNSGYSFSEKDTKSIIDEILNLKCGYLTNNGASGNLGMIRTKDNMVTINYIIRSIDEAELEEINDKSKALNNKFQANEIYRDATWRVNKESDLLSEYKSIYFNEYNEYPKEKIGHCGYECSSIKKRIDGLDIISVGSSIEKYHTVEETTYISSWIKVYNLLVKLIGLL